MSRIDHQRPILRIIDNYRRMRKTSAQAGDNSPSRYQPKKAVRRQRMPVLTQAGENVVLEMFEVFNSYLLAESAFASTLLPGKQANRKKASLNLGREKKLLEDACVKVIVGVIEQSLLGDKSLHSWLVWYQKDAKKDRGSALHVLLEVGFKPAFERVEGVLRGM